MSLTAWLVLSVGGAVLVALEFPPGDWLASLARPGPLPQTPVMAVVSCLLLALCAAAAWRVDQRARAQRRACALRLFLLQLALSFAWLAILFGGHALGPAVAVMAVLWLTVVAMAAAFSRVDRVAGLLALPFLAWVTFLFQQNVALWILN